MPGGVFTACANNRYYQMTRGADAPYEVLDGDLDVALCGSDVMVEGRLAGLLRPIGYKAIASSGCKLVLATSEGVTPETPLKIATSYPLSALYYLAQLGINPVRVKAFGGKIEGKVRYGDFNAVVDITETGQTLLDNDLYVRRVLNEDITLGIAFRREPYDPDDYRLEAWRQLAEIQTMEARALQYKNGKTFDPSKKSSLSLIDNTNRWVKAFAEESGERIQSMVDGVNELGEACDVKWANEIGLVRRGIRIVRMLNESFERNTTPTLWLDESELQ